MNLRRCSICPEDSYLTSLSAVIQLYSALLSYSISQRKAIVPISVHLFYIRQRGHRQ